MHKYSWNPPAQTSVLRSNPPRMQKAPIKSRFAPSHRCDWETLKLYSASVPFPGSCNWATTMHTPQAHTQLAATADQIWAACDRMTQLVIKHLDPVLWQAKPPGGVRTIAAMVPGQLNRSRITPQQAQAALAESAALCGRMLAEGLSGDGKIQHFRRDALARPWPVTDAGALQMLSYMLTHEAHHRGQICMIAHQLGCPLPGRVTARLWDWDGIGRLPESLRGSSPVE